MLQAAFGGYRLIDDDVTEYIESPVYYEPGFNIMSPLEIGGYKTDQFYILIRKRTDGSGLYFTNIDYSNLEGTVKDASNGEDVPFIFAANNIYDGWNDDPSSHVPIVLSVTNSINLNDPAIRVKVLDCFVRDTSDDSFISFRVNLEDENEYFHYLPVEMNNISDRNTYTAIGREVYIRINSSSDYYILFSPYAYLSESEKADADFSYPLNSVFYKRQQTYNDENYSFSASFYSDTFMSDVISVINVPDYHKAGVILVDNMLYKLLVEGGENVYMDISVVGQLSANSDTFRINFIT